MADQRKQLSQRETKYSESYIALNRPIRPAKWGTTTLIGKQKE